MVRRSPLGIRRCLACGYSGRFAQASAHDIQAHGGHCPRCGCDFTLRPPRSYAEMEGLDTLADPRHSTIDPATLESRMIERWLVFLFAMVVALVAAGVLVSALLSSVNPRI